MKASIKAVLKFLGVMALVDDHYHRKLVDALERALDCHVVGHVPVNNYQALLKSYRTDLQVALDDVLDQHLTDLDIGRVVPPAKLFGAFATAGVSSVQDMLKMKVEALENLLASSEYPFSQLLLVMHPDVTPLHQVQLNTLEVQARNAALGRR
jgi:hypothetical protein